jgi:hypothetical protein
MYACINKSAQHVCWPHLEVEVGPGFLAVASFGGTQETESDVEQVVGSWCIVAHGCWVDSVCLMDVVLVTW